MNSKKIAIFTPNLDLQPEAAQLAQQLQIPVIPAEVLNLQIDCSLQTAIPGLSTAVSSRPPVAHCQSASSASAGITEYDYFLILTHDHLSLQKNHSNARPLVIDFLSATLQYRRKHATLRNEILARALGLKNKTPRYIIDATAGLARDSFILAALGFEVTVLERSPIIHALIADGIKRAKLHPETAEISNRLHLTHTNAISWLEKTQPLPEIIYLDPMFPPSKKSALSKQDMRIFHEVVGDDLDGDQLLTTALACATERVVVKRPSAAEPLAGLTPTLSMKGSSSRFDIYLMSHLRA